MEFEQRLSREMLKIASWPRGPLQDADALLDHLLAHAGGILEAPRVLLAWEEADEPWLYLAHRSGGGIERSREAPLADPEAIEELLRRRFAIDRVDSWPVRGETVQGRLFALDRPDPAGDSLVLGNVLGKIVAQRVAAELDQFYLTHQLRTAAVTDERVRLACDLHDGMLQSLTGTALQLQALAKWMEKEPPAPPADLREILREIQQLIAADQRDLRFFIEELKPVPRPLAGQEDLASRLAELVDRLKRLWFLDIDIHLEGLDGQLSEAFTRQLYRLVRESLFNVARHAGASRVRVEIVWRERALSITVTDDGRGFPFTGRYDHEELRRQKLGPVSLKERIAALGGSIAIDTGPGLTRLEMHLPAQGGTR
jgi:signal transduction histidine kinase